MDPELKALVEEKLNADPDIAVGAGLLILAACDGDERLAAELDDTAHPSGGEQEAGASPEPVGAYLTSIAVEGFRGIGPRAELPIELGPGLTLVTGPNGCGKSSFAEGLEILLTGSNKRWEDRSAVWKEGWRSLHHEGPVRVEARLAIEGETGETLAERRWDVGSSLDQGVATAQTVGKPRSNLSALGWDDALANFRPFLSYNELGATLDAGPTRIFDQVSKVLGLDALVAARDLLRKARLAREKSLKDATDGCAVLLRELESLDDERARRCVGALEGSAWNLESIRTLLSEPAGSDPTDALTVLRQLAAVEVPDETATLEICERLRGAQSGVNVASQTDAGRALRIARLLASAVQFHDHFDDSPCPVCGVGMLDTSWRGQADQQIESLRSEAAEAQSAQDALDAAIRAVRSLIQQSPEVLDGAQTVGIDVAGLRITWDDWLAGLDNRDGDVLAGHVETALPAVREAARDVREQAEAEMERREDAWRPVAKQLLEWLPAARTAQAGAMRLSDLDAAENWLQNATDSVRAERFAPIAERSAGIWSRLRQGSSVDITRFGLTGSGTHRRLAVDVTVDGVESAALGVMSQGELHSLALSLFLPRATLPASPFRFVVIDDPVQAMDPSKVDGLARVLSDVAEERQVIVFTHDDRLPEAVRRLGILARHLQVARREQSVVEVRPVSDPVVRYLDDARALVHTPELSQDVAGRVVPVFCRSAVEAACLEVVRRRRIARGTPHAEVERTLEQALSLKAKASLALFDESGRGGETSSKINERFGRHARDAFNECNRGSHEGLPIPALQRLIDGSEQLVRGIRSLK